MDRALSLFLAITFLLHGLAFTYLAARRRKGHYLLLVGTFTFLTAIYLLRFQGWNPIVPGLRWPASWLLRIGALACTLSYLGAIYNEKGSWLWRLREKLKGASEP
jgi:hypothetical protein